METESQTSQPTTTRPQPSQPADTHILPLQSQSLSCKAAPPAPTSRPVPVSLERSRVLSPPVAKRATRPLTPIPPSDVSRYLQARRYQPRPNLNLPRRFKKTHGTAASAVESPSVSSMAPQSTNSTATAQESLPSPVTHPVPASSSNPPPGSLDIDPGTGLLIVVPRPVEARRLLVAPQTTSSGSADQVTGGPGPSSAVATHLGSVSVETDTGILLLPEIARFYDEEVVRRTPDPTYKSRRKPGSRRWSPAETAVLIYYMQGGWEEYYISDYNLTGMPIIRAFLEGFGKRCGFKRNEKMFREKLERRLRGRL